MRKVLFIAYPFPPQPGAGVHRVVQFAKYLPEFGWEPYILTSCSETESGDITPLRELNIRDDQITRVGRWPHRCHKEAVSYQKTTLDSWGNHVANPSKNIRYSRFRRLISQLQTQLVFPDKQFIWGPFAYQAAKLLTKKHNFEMIFSTSFPITDHFIAWKLHNATGLPWVADFRDQWSNNPILIETMLGARRKLNWHYENKILYKANAVITVSKLWCEQLSERVTPVQRHKFFTITNAYDPDLFTNIKPRRPNKLVFLYTGNLYAGRRDPSLFLSTLAELRNRNLIDINDIDVVFVGKFLPWIEELSHILQLGEMVKQLGILSHQQVIEMQVSASVLLHLQTVDETSRGWIAAKVFEYLGARRPILALAPPEEEVSRIVMDTEAGIVVHPDEKEKLSEIIVQWYKEFKITGDVRYLGREDKIANYSRRPKAQQLANIFDQFV